MGHNAPKASNHRPWLNLERLSAAAHERRLRELFKPSQKSADDELEPAADGSNRRGETSKRPFERAVGRVPYGSKSKSQKLEG